MNPWQCSCWSRRHESVNFPLILELLATCRMCVRSGSRSAVGCTSRPRCAALSSWIWLPRSWRRGRGRLAGISRSLRVGRRACGCCLILGAHVRFLFLVRLRRVMGRWSSRTSPGAGSGGRVAGGGGVVTVTVGVMVSVLCGVVVLGLGCRSILFRIRTSQCAGLAVHSRPIRGRGVGHHHSQGMRACHTATW